MPLEKNMNRISAKAYYIAVGIALFSGFGQMPITKRYYISDLPLMGWSQDFFILSDLHYLASFILLFLLVYRLTVSKKREVVWSWGPKTMWGSLLLLLLVVSGAFKAACNMGVFIPPHWLVILDFTHLFSAMALMVTGLLILVRKLIRKPLRTKTS